MTGSRMMKQIVLSLWDYGPEAEPIVYLSVYILRSEEQTTALRNFSCWFCYGSHEADFETCHRALIGAL